MNKTINTGTKSKHRNCSEERKKKIIDKIMKSLTETFSLEITYQEPKFHGERILGSLPRAEELNSDRPELKRSVD